MVKRQNWTLEEVAFVLTRFETYRHLNNRTEEARRISQDLYDEKDIQRTWNSIRDFRQIRAAAINQVLEEMVNIPVNEEMCKRVLAATQPRPAATKANTVGNTATGGTTRRRNTTTRTGGATEDATKDGAPSEPYVHVAFHIVDEISEDGEHDTLSGRSTEAIRVTFKISTQDNRGTGTWSSMETSLLTRACKELGIDSSVSPLTFEMVEKVRAAHFPTKSSSAVEKKIHDIFERRGRSGKASKRRLEPSNTGQPEQEGLMVEAPELNHARDANMRGGEFVLSESLGLPLIEKLSSSGSAPQAITNLLRTLHSMKVARDAFSSSEGNVRGNAILPEMLNNVFESCLGIMSWDIPKLKADLCVDGNIGEEEADTILVNFIVQAFDDVGEFLTCVYTPTNTEGYVSCEHDMQGFKLDKFFNCLVQSFLFASLESVETPIARNAEGGGEPECPHHSLQLDEFEMQSRDDATTSQYGRTSGDNNNSETRELTWSDIEKALEEADDDSKYDDDVPYWHGIMDKCFPERNDTEDYDVNYDNETCDVADDETIIAEFLRDNPHDMRSMVALNNDRLAVARNFLIAMATSNSEFASMVFYNILLKIEELINQFLKASHPFREATVLDIMNAGYLLQAYEIAADYLCRRLTTGCEEEEVLRILTLFRQHTTAYKSTSKLSSLHFAWFNSMLESISAQMTISIAYTNSSSAQAST